MARLKGSIVQVKAESNCLAHALVIAKAKVDGDDKNYQSYRRGNNIRPVVDSLIETTGRDLSRVGRVPELMRFQEHFKEYRIVVFGGSNCEDIYFDGGIESEKRINQVYDAVQRHFHVINSLTKRWLKGIYAKAVIRALNVARLISVERRVASAGRFVHVCSPKNEPRASPATEILEVVRVSKNIRRTNWKVRQSAKRCEIAPCVKRA